MLICRISYVIYYFSRMAANYPWPLCTPELWTARHVRLLRKNQRRFLMIVRSVITHSNRSLTG